MKLTAFYVSGLLILCVMVFGGIEGFSFKLRVETGEFLSDTSSYHLEHTAVDQHSLLKQIKTGETPEKKAGFHKLKSGTSVRTHSFDVWLSCYQYLSLRCEHKAA